MAELTERDTTAGEDAEESGVKVIGGFRGTTEEARFTAQLIGMVEPPDKARVKVLAERHRISQSKVTRAIIARGLPEVEAGLADGSIDARLLP